MEEVKKKHLEQLLHSNRVSKINRIYAEYRLAPTEHALNDLLKEVIKISLRKLRPQAAKMGDVGLEDHDDFSQKVAMTVFEKLPEFDREPQAFYPWLMTIVNFHREDLFDHLERGASCKVPIMLEDQDGNEYENPQLYADSIEGIVTYRPPTGLEEEDEMIYDLILDGYTQDRIADAIGIAPRTLDRRIRSLKNRFGDAVNA